GVPGLLQPGVRTVPKERPRLPRRFPGRTAGGQALELRLSGPIDGNRLYGVLLGPGDHRTRTEDRARPPRVVVGDTLYLGSPPSFEFATRHLNAHRSDDSHAIDDPQANDDRSAIVAEVVAVAGRRAELVAEVVAVAGRRVELVAKIDGDALWQAIYAAGRPVQYAHRPDLLPLWSVQTAYAARPWAAEMPSAGRPLTWELLLALRRAGIQIASLTHAAGLSSTGDDALDRALPWPERYQIPRRTSQAIGETRRHGGR